MKSAQTRAHPVDFCIAGAIFLPLEIFESSMVLVLQKNDLSRILVQLIHAQGTVGKYRGMQKSTHLRKS